MVDTSVTKYNTTDLSGESFSELFRTANEFMGGGMGYGLVFVVWLISMSLFSQYPNVDALKASSYSAWLTAVLFSVFGVVPATFPMALFILVAALVGYQQVNSP